MEEQGSERRGTRLPGGAASAQPLLLHHHDATLRHNLSFMPVMRARLFSTLRSLQHENPLVG
ncbi:uncharacterized protein BKA78DRAFT_316480 [Phyllosticta capitalensis]|uniref:uncharacterized protein n=1 Tax=Phyllosticta capitalensis TaxID=121624 RepID=UPI00312E8A7D